MKHTAADVAEAKARAAHIESEFSEHRSVEPTTNDLVALVDLNQALDAAWATTKLALDRWQTWHPDCQCDLDADCPIDDQQGVFGTAEKAGWMEPDRAARLQMTAEAHEHNNRILEARITELERRDGIILVSDGDEKYKKALREIGNLAGAPTMEYAPDVAQGEMRTHLDAIAEIVRRELAP